MDRSSQRIGECGRRRSSLLCLCDPRNVVWRDGNERARKVSKGHERQFKPARVADLIARYRSFVELGLMGQIDHYEPSLATSVDHGRLRMPTAARRAALLLL